MNDFLTGFAAGQVMSGDAAPVPPAGLHGSPPWWFFAGLLGLFIIGVLFLVVRDKINGD